MSNAGRQRVMARYKCHRKELHAKRKKESYAQMEPAMKKKVLSDKAIWYKSLDLAEKESFYLTELNGINYWIPKEKKSFCLNQQIGIKYRLLTRNEDAIGLSPRWLKANFIRRKSQNAEELRNKFTIRSIYFHLNFFHCD